MLKEITCIYWNLSTYLKNLLSIHTSIALDYIRSSRLLMVIKFYTADLNPRVHSVMMAFDIFDVRFEKIEVDLINKDHLKPDYLAKNPLHTVPVLEDGDFILHDSQAMLMYLADTYGQDESWYPKDNKQRALVNQKLFFDTAVLFPRLGKIMYSIVIERKKNAKQKWIDNVEEGYGYMEQFLSRTAYIAGEHVTIADLSVYSNMSCLVYAVPLEPHKYPKTIKWLKEMEQKPYCVKHNNPGASTFGDIVKHVQETLPSRS